MNTLKRRLNLLESDEIPTKSELKDQMKDIFSEIILETMNPHAQEIMGYKQFLKGPSNLLWISPENHLNNKVIITEQQNENCINILTSDGVEQVGSVIDNKIKKKINSKIQRALDSQEYFYKIHCNNIIKEAIENEIKIHSRNRNDIKQKYVELFKNEYENLRSMFKKERQQITKDLEKNFQKKMQNLNFT